MDNHRKPSFFWKIVATFALSLSVLLLSNLLSTQAVFADGQHNKHRPVFVDVKANVFFNATGIHADPGETFLIKAQGIVDLSNDNGGYNTEPDGAIVITPPTNSGSFQFFRDRAGPINTDPIRGSRKSLLPLTAAITGHLPGAPYGALVAGFSPTSSPSSFNDFPDGFALINERVLPLRRILEGIFSWG